MEMKLQKIEKKWEGKYITRYDLTYETQDGKEKVYEMISRDSNMDSTDKLHNEKPDAVVMIMHDVTGEKILLNREFRLAVDREVINFPAGLVDPGETPLQSAKRELWEETGLTLTKVKDVIDKSFGATGFSNETNFVVVGVAEGEFAPSTSNVEEIKAAWYTKEQVRKLLRTDYFAARTQAYCYLWADKCPVWAKILEISEADFGCEERPEGAPKLALVHLQTLEGEEIVREVPDDVLVRAGLDEGSYVDENDRKLFFK